MLHYQLGFMWELPQNLLGFSIFLFLRKKKLIHETLVHEDRRIMKTVIGISLGRYIFWSADEHNSVYILPELNKYHEFGHGIQSKMLGPLYLFIVGIPSACRVLYARFYYAKYHEQWTGYYKGFPEKWADALGGIDSTQGIIKNHKKILF